jgi:glycine dehydrogenase subunit 2
MRHYLGLERVSPEPRLWPAFGGEMADGPALCALVTALPGFLSGHPLAPAAASQGYLACVHELQELVRVLTGMHAVSLATTGIAPRDLPLLAMVRDYHRSRAARYRKVVLATDLDAARAQAAELCGFELRQAPLTASLELDVAALADLLDERVACVLYRLPAPSGGMCAQFCQVGERAHEQGVIVCADVTGVYGLVAAQTPARMGVDIASLRLNGALAHGLGDNGLAGALAACGELAGYLPVPVVSYDGDEYQWTTQAQCPLSAPSPGPFPGDGLRVLGSWAHGRLLGKVGLRDEALAAWVRAEYLAHRVSESGFEVVPVQGPRCGTLAVQVCAESWPGECDAEEIARRLLEHALFPPEVACIEGRSHLLITPAARESRAVLDAFVEALAAVRSEIQSDTAPRR